MSLRLRQLKVRVAEKLVVCGLDFQLRAGRKAVLMGPNGSGKSSLALALAGHPHYQIVSGTAHLGRLNLLKRTPDERARAGLLLAFQEPLAVPGLLVWQFCWQAYQARFREAKPRRGSKIASPLVFLRHLESLVPRVALPPSVLQRSLNDGFSGGEKKRLELLQLLLLEPRLAIFDEIDSGLDIDAIKVIAQGIEYLASEYGTSCLLITHYPRLLKQLSFDSVHLLSAGRWLAQGGAELVKQVEEAGYGAYPKQGGAKC